MAYTDTDTNLYEPISLSHSSDRRGLADHNCFDQFTLDYVNDNAMDDDPNDMMMTDMMMTDDSHHALGNIFAESSDAESSDNVIDFAADNDIIHNNEDLLLRDSAFSKFSVDSKLSTELANLFDDEDEAPQDQDHVDANGDLQFCTFLDDTATRNTNLMMMGIGTKIVVPTKYDDVVLPEPEPIGVAQVVQHVAAAAVHQETKPQEQPQPKARVLNHGYNVIRSTKSRRRRASQPEPYRPQVDEVKASKQVFEYSSPYNHEEYQNQVKKSEEEDDVARKRRSCNDLDLLMDVNSGAAGGIGGQEVPLGEIEPPQKHQRGVNGRRYQRRVTVDACVSGPPSLSDLFGRRPSSTQYSTNQYHRSGSYVSQESSPSAATATLHGILGTTTTTRRTSFQEQDNMERRGSYLEDILGTASTATASASTTTAAAASTSNPTENNPFQYHEALTKLAESMKRTELSRRQLKWYPSPQQVLGPRPQRRSSTSSDSLNALFGGVEETAAVAPTSSSSPFSNPIPTESVLSWLECSSPNVNNDKNKSTNNMAAFFSGSRGTLTNGLEQSRKQMRMYADELKSIM